MWKNRHIASAVRIAVPVLLLSFVLWAADWNRMAELVSKADYRFLLVAVLAHHVAVILQGCRWQVLLLRDGGSWPFQRLQVVHYVAMFFDLIAPGKIGSDAYRVAAFRESGKLHHVIMSLIALRLHGMAVAIFVATVTGTIVLGLKHGWIPVLGTVLVSLVVAAFVVRAIYRAARAGTLRMRSGEGAGQAFAGHVVKAHDAVKSILNHARTFWSAGALAIVFLLTVVAVYAAVGRSFGMSLPFSSYLAVVPLLLVASALPITYHGRGVTEVVAIWLWEGGRATQEQIILTCLAVLAVTWVQALLGGCVWLFTGRTTVSREAADIR